MLFYGHSSRQKLCQKMYHGQWTFGHISMTVYKIITGHLKGSQFTKESLY